jgi:hypothetical protein
MAATGFTPISLYYTTTASATPTAGNLVAGELAINTNDGKLFYKDSSGVVQTIATKATSTVAGSTTQVIYNNAGAYAGSAALTYDGTTFTTTGAANFATSTGNVGIGTASPGTKLQVVGTTLLSSASTYGASSAAISVYNGTSSANYYKADNHYFQDGSGNTTGQINSAGLLQFNSGYGSAATAYGCRAWANWNGSSASPITPRGNGNVSSVTKNSTGDFTVNFSTSMPDANYSVVGTGQRNNTNLLIVSIKGSSTYNSINTGSVNIRTTDEAGNLVDALAVCIAVFR